MRNFSDINIGNYIPIDLGVYIEGFWSHFRRILTRLCIVGTQEK